MDFVQSHLRDFMCNGYGNRAGNQYMCDDALGTFDVFFSQGYYQNSKPYIESMMNHVNANQKSVGVLVKPEVMDLVTLSLLLTKASADEIAGCFDFSSLRYSYYASSAALRRAENMADPECVSLIDQQNQLDPYHRRPSLIDAGTRHPRLLEPPQGELTKQVVSNFKTKADLNPVELEVFLLSVGFCTPGMDCPDLPGCALWEPTVCYYCESDECVVCLWNGYSKDQILEFIDACPVYLQVRYWEAPADEYIPDCGMFGIIQGKSLHRKYLFCMTGPSLANQRIGISVSLF
jgi:hypothetical protein